MIDFPFDEPCLFSSLICVAIYAFNIFFNKIDIIYPDYYSYTKGKQVATILLITIFVAIFCLDGDFFHFLLVVRYFDFSVGAYNYGEPVYHLLTSFVHSNYLLFRLIVWGGAFLIFCLTAKRFNIPVYYAAVLLFATYPVTFCYARVSLAMAIYFLGASFFCSPIENKKIGYLLGFFIIILSNYFHTSIIVLAALTVVFFLPVNKRTVFLVLILLPIIAQIAQRFFIDMAVDADSIENVDRAKRIVRNAESENNGLFYFSLSAPGVFLHKTLNYVSFYVPNIIISRVCLKHLDELPSDVVGLFKIMISTLLLSTVFIFFSSGSSVMIYRVLYMTMIPIILLTCKLNYINYLSIKTYHWLIYPGISYSIVRILYCLYAYH